MNHMTSYKIGELQNHRKTPPLDKESKRGRGGIFIWNTTDVPYGTVPTDSVSFGKLESFGNIGSELDDTDSITFHLAQRKNFPEKKFLFVTTGLLVQHFTTGLFLQNYTTGVIKQN